jgi:hypothetical protein
MDIVYPNIKIIILDTFFYEEETISHVENYLRYQNIHNYTRDEIKRYILELLKEDFLKLYNDPSNGKIEFQNSIEEFLEDYWFALTEKGFNELKKYRQNN